MASTTPMRRPLAPLNSNNAFSSQASRVLSSKSPKKQAFMEKPLSTTVDERKGAGENEQAGRLDGKERRYNDDDNDVREHKRQRRTGPDADSPIQEYGQQLGRQVEGALEEDGKLDSDVEIRHELQDNGPTLQHLVSPSPEDYASSPSSSEDSGLASPVAVNDSQNTTITVPDEDLAANWLANVSSIIPPQPLSTEEIRQKAREIKLRLSLANYKVRTNQIDVPISRLQIRSSMYPSRIGPSSSRISRTTLSRIPNIETSPMKHTTSGLSTPLLPRQREGLLNPPLLGSPEERQLTSSGVKGRAADGLLSLMRHNA